MEMCWLRQMWQKMGQFDDNSVYMTIGTLESYVPIRAHFGAETMIPVHFRWRMAGLSSTETNVTTVRAA